MAFIKAKRSNVKLKLALLGISGMGKTYTALSIAKGLGNKIAVIDTENGSSQMYADRFDFDVMAIRNYAPSTFISAIQDAAKNGYDVLIIDSFSHSWAGQDGILDMVDKEQKITRNQYTAWSTPSKLHTQVVEAILHAPIHVIVTMRAKADYAIEDSGGKKKVVKVGMKPIQRDEIEYEFDFVGRFVDVATLHIEKSRLESMTNKLITIDALNEKLGQHFLSILNSDTFTNEPSQSIGEDIAQVDKSKLLKEVVALAKSKNMPNEQVSTIVKSFGVETAKDLNEEQLETLKDLIVRF
jgi:hypothetical protein